MSWWLIIGVVILLVLFLLFVFIFVSWNRKPVTTERFQPDWKIKDGTAIPLNSNGLSMLINRKDVKLDLSKLDHITPLGDGLVSIGSAAKMIDLHHRLARRGFFLPGSLGKHTLEEEIQFNLPHFSVKKYGYLSENVVSLELICFDGKRMIIDQDHHPDLFWALRGTGQNPLGIIASYTLDLPEIPKQLMVFRIFYKLEALPVILEWATARKSKKSSNFSARVKASKDYLVIEGLYLGTQEGLKKHIFNLPEGEGEIREIREVNLKEALEYLEDKKTTTGITRVSRHKSSFGVDRLSERPVELIAKALREIDAEFEIEIFPLRGWVDVLSPISTSHYVIVYHVNYLESVPWPFEQLCGLYSKMTPFVSPYSMIKFENPNDSDFEKACYGRYASELKEIFDSYSVGWDIKDLSDLESIDQPVP
jgi:hypothetical protein